MTSNPDYEPSPLDWVREQVELIESSGGTRGTLATGGEPVVLLTCRGAKSGKLRKAPLMRVADGDRYAAIASLAGSPKNPNWYNNLKADPWVIVQDGPTVVELRARGVFGEEREFWWRKAVEVYPTYDEYQEISPRTIPVLVLEPVAD